VFTAFVATVKQGFAINHFIPITEIRFASTKVLIIALITSMVFDFRQVNEAPTAAAGWIGPSSAIRCACTRRCISFFTNGGFVQDISLEPQQHLPDCHYLLLDVFFQFHALALVHSVLCMLLDAKRRLANQSV
jgi:hypothetical protein